VRRRRKGKRLPWPVWTRFRKLAKKGRVEKEEEKEKRRNKRR